MANQLIDKAKGTGAFYNLYTQFVSDAPVWRIEPDRDRMASLQVDFGTAMKVLGAVNGGAFVNQTYENGQYRQVYVQAEGSKRETIQSLENLYVPAAGGTRSRWPTWSPCDSTVHRRSSATSTSTARC